MATVRLLRLLGVVLVLYAMVGWYIFSPAEVPADAVRVRLWLFVSGVVALIVDEVCERITREAREVMDRKGREREQKSN
jgi:hypothetical protein